MGMLSAVGMRPVVCSSLGVRTSIRWVWGRVEGGVLERVRIWGGGEISGVGWGGD